MARIRIGTSGWSYSDWKGAFYPETLRAADQLTFLATRFETAEINASFYRLPTETAVMGWHDRVPEGFVFAWKASRYITHQKRLIDVEDSLALAFDRMAGLDDRFGPVLFQLPPSLKRDDERLAAFLGKLPGDRRVTVEFRHPSWYEARVFERLRDHDVALCVSDHHHAPSPWERTASWAYVRGHGPGGRYHGSYEAATLRAWARTLIEWAEDGIDAYVYFDNDIRAAAPADASRLKALLGQGETVAPIGGVEDGAEAVRASWPPMRIPRSKSAGTPL